MAKTKTTKPVTSTGITVTFEGFRKSFLESLKIADRWATGLSTKANAKVESINRNFFRYAVDRRTTFLTQLSKKLNVTITVTIWNDWIKRKLNLEQVYKELSPSSKK